MQSNTFYKYKQDFLNVNPCLTCNFVQPTPLSFLHQLYPVMPTFSVDEIAWKKKKKHTHTSLCCMPALNEVSFWTDVRAKRKCYILLCHCSVVFNMMLFHNLSRLLYMSWFFCVYSSSGHEIIIPRTSFLYPHSKIVCISKQRPCYLIRCLDRGFFTFICFVQMEKIGGKKSAGLLSLYVSFTVYHELALEDS